MTNKEELQYLTALVLEASKWRISEGDDTDTIRLEVQDRIRRLTGINTTDANGLNQSEPVEEETEPGEFVERVSKVPDKHTLGCREARRRYVQTHTRAWFDGKQSFYPNDQVADIMLPNNRIKHVHKKSKEYKRYLETHPGFAMMEGLCGGSKGDPNDPAIISGVKKFIEENPDAAEIFPPMPNGGENG